ncbi:hypothetical protein SAMN04488002_0168 [Litoreibacter janthinus]|uniref:Uncharacterized protein n=1 Tax=Litoreibacter janthinus TaxID=670154 RepID=A0A1I6FRU7_9RHOB|nr:hypothetical protein SAMN04488002_0168 [Litoreibacter janthinus]
MHPPAALWGYQGIFRRGAFLGALSAHSWPGGLLIYHEEEGGWDGRSSSTPLTLITFSARFPGLGHSLGHFGATVGVPRVAVRDVSKWARSHRYDRHPQQHPSRHPCSRSLPMVRARCRGGATFGRWEGSRTSRGSGCGQRRLSGHCCRGLNSGQCLLSDRSVQ